MAEKKNNRTKSSADKAKSSAAVKAKAATTAANEKSATATKKAPAKTATKKTAVKAATKTTAKKAPAKTATVITVPKKTAVKAAATKKTAAKTSTKKTPPAAAKAAQASKPTTGRQDVHFKEKDLDDFRKALMHLRDDLLGKVAYLHDSSLRRNDDIVSAEDGSDAFDRIVSLERAGGVQQRVNAIDEALREIDDGSYGICQICSSLIGKQRLLALPFARNCIECQEATERHRGNPSLAQRLTKS